MKYSNNAIRLVMAGNDPPSPMP